MAKLEVLLPAMGEGIIEATLTRILCPEGTQVDADQAIVEVATDKVDSEVLSTEAGIVEKIYFAEGAVVGVGQVIAVIRTASDVADAPSLPLGQAPTAIPAVQPEALQYAENLEAEIAQRVEETQISGKQPVNTTMSPLVRSIALAEGISDQELSSIQGSGLEGRLTKPDILDYLNRKKAAAIAPVAAKQTSVQPQASAPIATPTVPPVKTSALVAQPGTELIEMDRMRRLIYDHMLKSKQTSPHVSSFVEVDMSPIVHWRERNKKGFETKYGQKLTFTPFFVEATVKALRDYPMVNVSVDGYTIIKKNFINIGMATALPSGNLIVPVIKDADQKNLAGLSAAVNDLAERARNNKLRPDEVMGSTFTITNVGSFGNITGTPIINQPEVAILAVGMIQKKPAVIETPQGDTLGIRHQMILALSYDHRVVDGALGGMFLRRVADYLERFDTSRVV